MEMLKHEELFRGKNISNLADYEYWMGGCGALGSNIAEGLARMGGEYFTLVDMDRIEVSNLGTQPWYQEEIGLLKVDAASRRLYRINKSKYNLFNKKFEESTFNKVKPASGKSCIIIDVFDNWEARKDVKKFHVKGNGYACIHAGMSGDGFGQVVWDEDFVIPKIEKKEGVDVCEYPLARNLVLFVATLATEAIVEFITKGKKANYYFTLLDAHIDKKYVKE